MWHAFIIQIPFSPSNPSYLYDRRSSPMLIYIAFDTIDSRGMICGFVNANSLSRHNKIYCLPLSIKLMFIIKDRTYGWLWLLIASIPEICWTDSILLLIKPTDTPKICESVLPSYSIFTPCIIFKAYIGYSAFLFAKNGRQIVFTE